MSKRSKHTSDHRRKRTSQPAGGLLGNAYNSPTKSRPTATKQRFEIFGLEYKRNTLRDSIEALKAASHTSQATLLCVKSEQQETVDNSGRVDAHRDLESASSSLQDGDNTPGDIESGMSHAHTPQAGPSSREENLTLDHEAQDTNWETDHEMDVRADSPTPSNSLSPAALQKPVQPNPLPMKTRKPRATEPSSEKKKKYDRWLDLIPALIPPYLKRLKQTYRQKDIPPVASDISGCLGTNPCNLKHHKRTVLCLFAHHFQHIEVDWCDSCPLPVVLLTHGLFPTSPSLPRIAVSVELLNFFRSLFAKSTDAINALASALNDHYHQRGFRLTNDCGDEMLDPFRRSLADALQWYECLLCRVTEKTEALIESAERSTRTNCDERLQLQPVSGNAHTSGAENSQPDIAYDIATKKLPPALDQTQSQCHRILRERCPGCFGGDKFGRSFGEGSDIIVSVDGTFNHRHLANRGDCPLFWIPRFFLSKAYVDKIGDDIEAAKRKSSRKKGKKSGKASEQGKSNEKGSTALEVPDAAVDDCEKSHEAGSGSNVKTYMEQFDDAGVMALVCRHDIPLAAANIDTPGEQQKYAVALIQYIFSLIPSNATVLVLYDVACVLNRSRQLYDLFLPAVSDRLSFACSAMHSYAHAFECQIMNNPRYRDGMGLSDGEGTERLWSQMTGLVSITRNVSRHRRIFLLDSRLHDIGQKGRDGLGRTLSKKLKKGIPEHELSARQAVADSNATVDDLKRFWENQKEAQLSVRAHAPARIKRELDAVFALQTQLEEVEATLAETRQTMTSENSNSDVASVDSVMKTLEAQQQEIVRKVEGLYDSLNIHESFPELKGVDVEFLRTLLILRDLKLSVRKRAVSSFSEWDRLNQAKEGRNVAIGTKLHQYARKSIAKRTPALRRSLKKFNDLCSKLAKLWKPEWNIPLPEPLPEDLHNLQHNSTIMEDVWISEAPAAQFSWLYDSDIRNGMRGALKLDRCVEEVQRIGREYDIMCAWFGQRLIALHLALTDPQTDPDFHVTLEHAITRLLELKSSWATKSTSARYEYYVENAARLAQTAYSAKHGKEPPLYSLQWTEVVIAPTIVTQDADPDVEDPLDDEYSHVAVSNVQEILDDIENTDEGCAPEPERAAEEKPELVVVPMNEQLSVDYSLQAALPLATSLQPESSRTRRVFYSQSGYDAQHRFRTVFSEEDLQILSTPDARLTGGCLNSSAALLLDMHIKTDAKVTAERCCIFSSYGLTIVRNNAGIDRIWSLAKHTGYWNKDVWIIPVHRVYPAEHWVCIVVLWKTRQMFVYDSFNSAKAWRKDIKASIIFTAQRG